MSASKHTALLWRVEYVGVTSAGDDGEDVCEVITQDGHRRVADGLRAPNAELIVRAVNCHADLLAALRDLCATTPDSNAAEWIAARAAIAKAEGRA